VPVHIGEVTSDVTMFDSELPLSEAQLERLVSLVARRLGERRRAEEQTRAATTLRRDAAPPDPIGA
jgi:hypothetical protein